LKKKLGASISELRYKAGAIRECAAHISGAVNLENLRTWTIVPVPPSKHKSENAYDDRMVRICKSIASPQALDIRELVVQSQSTVAAHEVTTGSRPTVSDLLKIYSIDESVTQPAPTGILIVDDVLTAGTHYRAMHTVLFQRFPGIPINAIFIARRVFPPDELATV
jgi:predicted amidophosphoribosyltransferase